MPTLSPAPYFWRRFALLYAGGHVCAQTVGYVSPSEGPSMLPTFHVRGDWIWVSALYRRGRGVVAGDVVALRHPWYPDAMVSKRVLGLPGDVVLRDTPNTEKGAGQQMIQVPQGHCWIAGDNSPDSLDSRDYGPVPLALIRGKVVARVLPLRRMGWMENTMRPVREDDL